VKLLTLCGPPFDRGRTYGETLRAEIGEQIRFLRAFVHDQAGLDPDTFFAHVLTLGWVEAVERWTPELLDEVRGIAIGANHPFADLFAWQCVQEIFWYLPYHVQGSATPASGCSVLADAGDAEHPTILAQNADTIPFWHHHQTLLHIIPPEEDEPELLIMTYPGLIGPYGLTSAGLGICVNALFYNLNNSTRGLCTPFLTRGVLSQHTYEEAVAFIKAVPHASGNTLTIGAPGKVMAFEASANQVVPYMLAHTPHRTCHTNHVLASDDFRPNASRDPYPNSVDRLNILRNALDALPGPLTVDGAKKILSSHGEQAQLCRHEDNAHGSMTTYCMVMVLDDHPRLHVSLGPPCREAFHTLEFTRHPCTG